jgi:hypothetical protein
MKFKIGDNVNIRLNDYTFLGIVIMTGVTEDVLLVECVVSKKTFSKLQQSFEKQMIANLNSVEEVFDIIHFVPLVKKYSSETDEIFSNLGLNENNYYLLVKVTNIFPSSLEMVVFDIKKEIGI